MGRVKVAAILPVSRDDAGTRGPVLVVSGMAIEAAAACGAGVETLHGLGGARLSEQLALRLRAPCRGVLSFGLAGGLDPALRPGAIVIGDAVAGPDGRVAADAAWTAALLQALPPARRGVLAGVELPVSTVAAKRELYLRHAALAVDMESHLVAALARAHGLPFAICRVVVDPAERPVPPAALAGLGPSGAVNLPGLLRALASEPMQLPGLLRLAVDAAMARRALRFARRQVGAGFGLPQAPDPTD
jgi:hopanoid-associated phosphorylase